MYLKSVIINSKNTNECFMIILKNSSYDETFNILNNTKIYADNTRNPSELTRQTGHGRDTTNCAGKGKTN